MCHGSVGRNESPEKVPLCVKQLCFTQDAPLNVQSKYCTLTLLLSSKLRIYVHPVRH